MVWAKRVIPFQAGSWGHGTGRNAKAVGPGEQTSKSTSRIYWSVGRSRTRIILPDHILPTEKEHKIFFFLVNIYNKNQLFYDSVIKHFLG